MLKGFNMKDIYCFPKYWMKWEHLAYSYYMQLYVTWLEKTGLIVRERKSNALTQIQSYMNALLDFIVRFSLWLLVCFCWLLFLGPLAIHMRSQGSSWCHGWPVVSCACRSSLWCWIKTCGVDLPSFQSVLSHQWPITRLILPLHLSNPFYWNYTLACCKIGTRRWLLSDHTTYTQTFVQYNSAVIIIMIGCLMLRPIGVFNETHWCSVGSLWPIQGSRGFGCCLLGGGIYMW